MNDPFAPMFCSDYPRNSFSHYPTRCAAPAKSVPVNAQQPASHLHASAARNVPANVRRNPSASTPKVVSIPVRFVDSEAPVPEHKSKPESAVIIQKTWRGHRVRKTVKQIAAIKRQVDEIENKVGEKETVDLIKRDEKERLRLNEMLMSLLFKLDSVRGFDDGIRVYRKSVIRRAVLLQERIDSIVANESENSVHRSEDETETPAVALAENNLDPMARDEDGISSIIDAQINDSEVDGLKGELDTLVQIDSIEHEPKPPEGPVEHSVECVINGNTASDHQQVDVKPSESFLVDNQMGQCCNTEGEWCFVKSAAGDQKADVVEAQDDAMEEVSSELPVVVPKEDGEKMDKELLGKMAAENQKMMKMMTELFERNEIQTQMLSCMAQRIEQLEKAVASGSEKMRRKKMKKKNSAARCLPGCDK